MNDRVVPLAAGFASATRADWEALVEKTLKGGSAESLVSRTADGLPLKPLYTADDVGVTVGLGAPVRPDGMWDVRTIVRHPDIATANGQILEDLASGAGSVLVRPGSGVNSADDLARALDGVMTDVAPVALDAGFLGAKAADWLATAAKASPAAPLALHMDPLSALAEAGRSPGPIESHLISAATVGARLAEPYPRASLFLASGRVAHEAGASEAEELAFMAAAAVAYARALVRAGLSLDEAFGRIVLGLAVDSDYFVSIAKLRAARAIWGRIVEASGVNTPAAIEARSSARMLTRADAWTNLIRLTAAGFAGAVGGADAVALGAFTDALGHPTAFARRQARNTQLVLMEEAALGRVADPAAGAWWLEALTRDLAEAAWVRFQAIEANGGIVTALTGGLIAREVAAGREALRRQIAAGERKILGVTDFKAGDAAAVEVETPASPPGEPPSARLPGPDSHCPPLSPVRLEELAA